MDSDGCKQEKKAWKERAGALFFVDKYGVTQIAEALQISRKSVSAYLHSLPAYQEEKHRRMEESSKRRQTYKREWDRKNRKNRYGIINGETLRKEHDLAAWILSREKF